MATPEPEPDAYEKELVRVKMRAATFRGVAPGRLVGSLHALALVIGVKGYKFVSPLDNTLHDAEDFAALLESLGFKVMLLTDWTAPDGVVTMILMKKFRREFLQELTAIGAANTVCVFFYAGHGAEYDGLQYLLPQDWDDEPRALIDEAMCLQQTLEQIEEKKPLVTLAFLDCCRERVEVRGGVFGEGGLSALPGPAGSLVMFAAGQGKMAADGTATGSGRNGAFTAALLKHLGRPGLELADMAVDVTNEVKEATAGAQIPEYVSKLTTKNICLVPAAVSEGLPPRRRRRRSGPPLNPPGRWGAMISYTQRNPVAEVLAHAIHGELVRRGRDVWLDVKMAKRDEAAMEEGVTNSDCVIAIVTGPQEGKAEDTAYFKRPFCLKELRWAVDAGVFVQPIVAAEDKEKISELFAMIPDDLQHLGGVNWEHIDRKDKDYFELGVTKILKAADEAKAADRAEPEPEPEPDQEDDQPQPEPQPDQEGGKPQPEPELEPEPEPSPAHTKARVVTSQKTAHIGFVDEVLAELRKLMPELTDDDFFTQRDIDATKANEHWMTQWLAQAKGAEVTPCFVDVAYLESGPCCKEYLNAKQYGNELLVALDEPKVMGSVHPAGFNGPLISHFNTGGQCLMASAGQAYANAKTLATELAKKLGATTLSSSEPEPEPEPEPEELGRTRSPHPDKLKALAQGYQTSLDRPYVQKEIGWAVESGKKIIVIYEMESHRPGYF
eukprot:COSAG04_NODE_224_length_19624_cov_47.932855_21_plen_723_part_01